MIGLLLCPKYKEGGREREEKAGEERRGEEKGEEEVEGKERKGGRVNEKEKEKEEIREEILVSKYFLLLKRMKAF